MKKHELTAIEDALEHILRNVSSAATAVEDVVLSQAVGRVIAEAIKADINVPGYDNSAMDGFAVNTASINQSECTLAISQTIPAGSTGLL